MRQKILFTFFIFLTVAMTIVVSRSFRVAEIPNGNINSCDNCHVTPGGPRNDFGGEIEANFLTAPGSSGHVEWGPALAALDSDGDGVPNGVELQDPDGTWQSGDPAPGDPGMVTNPGDPDSFIPVELAAFSAFAVNGKVVLNWTTATETNNDGFQVERSLDQEEWSQIAFVEGVGTTSEVNKYNFTDEFPVYGTSFYRLIQRDYDGTEKVYGPKEVNFEGVTSYELAQNYPNPFNPTTNLSFTLAAQNQVVLDIYNSVGEKVSTLVNGVLQAGEYNYQFDASNLSSGVYIAHITAGEFSKSIKMMLMK
ncbi:MAG: hypothetical protein SCALA702_19190 [Melioribacteraceae bacterium]|nr:MAG: hypothetical protein SCALA702_19190 [Melioribacteraceae bacterium]